MESKPVRRRRIRGVHQEETPDKEAIVDGWDDPLRTCFTVEKGPGGWTFSKLGFRGKAVVSEEKTEPNIKAIILEKFKISAFKYWSKVEG